MLAVSLLVFWINEKSMTVISAETRSTHQWIYNWVDYGSSLYVCANTVNISCSTAEHYEVLSNFHPAWVIGPNSSRRWRNDGVGKVMQDYTRLPFTLDEFLNFFFRPMSVVAGSHLYLNCLKKKAKWPMIEGLSCSIPKVT